MNAFTSHRFWCHAQQAEKRAPIHLPLAFCGNAGSR
jgi:hypothetical protein